MLPENVLALMQALRQSGGGQHTPDNPAAPEFGTHTQWSGGIGTNFLQHVRQRGQPQGDTRGYDYGGNQLGTCGLIPLVGVLKSNV